MVVVALVVLPGPRVEEQVARGELEDEAGEGPHVGRGGVLGAEEDLVVVVVVVGGFLFWRLFFFPIGEFFSFFFASFLFLWKERKKKTICAIPASSAKPRLCNVLVDGRASQVKRGRWVSVLGAR